MLDALFIFRKNGSVLWQQVWVALKTDPVDDVIHSILLEDRGGSSAPYQDATYAAKWLVDDEFDLVVVAVYQRFLVLSYVDELLLQCRAAFCDLLRPMSDDERDNAFPCTLFTPIFGTIETEIKRRWTAQRSRAAHKPCSFTNSKGLSTPPDTAVDGGEDGCGGGGELLGRHVRDAVASEPLSRSTTNQPIEDGFAAGVT